MTMVKDKHNMFHYPNLTDVDSFRSNAIASSMIEPCTLHFHPYHDNGCEEGLKLRLLLLSSYSGLPFHERYVKGKLEEKI
jgi:hypothetical protein